MVDTIRWSITTASLFSSVVLFWAMAPFLFNWLSNRKGKSAPCFAQVRYKGTVYLNEYQRKLNFPGKPVKTMGIKYSVPRIGQLKL